MFIIVVDDKDLVDTCVLLLDRVIPDPASERVILFVETFLKMSFLHHEINQNKWKQMIYCDQPVLRLVPNTAIQSEVLPHPVEVLLRICHILGVQHFQLITIHVFDNIFLFTLKYSM